jgi:hypothetical protein
MMLKKTIFWPRLKTIFIPRSLVVLRLRGKIVPPPKMAQSKNFVFVKS